jgi:cytoskeletal protein RodZ
MSSVGETLKNTREAQRLTVTQVADMTKIRSDHIRAIDAGNYDVFSAPVYIKGFVRTYATALKLDPQAIMAQLNHELAAAGGAELPAFRPHKPSLLDSLMFHLSTTGRKLLLPLVAVALVGGLAAGGACLWRNRHPANPLAGLSSGLYQPVNPPAGETLPLPRH